MKTNNNACLWDANSYSCDKLIEFTKLQNGNKRFKNAVNHKLVISAGENAWLKIDFESITMKIIKNKLIVDCILANKNDKCKELYTFCHITCGLAFNPKTIIDGFQRIVKRAFINYKQRSKNNNPIIDWDRSTASINLIICHI